MTDATDHAATELDMLRADVAALREDVAALRLELESGPLATVACKEERRVIAADYWNERYARERETA